MKVSKEILATITFLALDPEDSDCFLSHLDTDCAIAQRLIFDFNNEELLLKSDVYEPFREAFELGVKITQAIDAAIFSHGFDQNASNKAIRAALASEYESWRSSHPQKELVGAR